MNSTVAREDLRLGSFANAFPSWHIGNSIVKITYTSETGSIINLEDGVDHLRKVYLNIVFENSLEHMLSSNTDALLDLTKGTIFPCSLHVS